MLQQFQAAMQMIQQMAMMNPAVAQQAMQMGLIDPEQLQMMAQAQAEAQSGPPSQQQGTPEERASRNPRDNSYAARIRARSANAASPN